MLRERNREKESVNEVPVGFLVEAQMIITTVTISARMAITMKDPMVIRIQRLDGLWFASFVLWVDTDAVSFSSLFNDMVWSG